MKKISVLFTLAATLFVLSGCCNCGEKCCGDKSACCSKSEKCCGKKAACCKKSSCCDKKTPCNRAKLRHVVLFGFEETATAEDIKAIEEKFAALPNEISEIKCFEWGIDCSPEGLQKGHTHAFILTFDSEADRDAYLVHPAHKAFGQSLGGKLKSATVVDVWVK